MKVTHPSFPADLKQLIDEKSRLQDLLRWCLTSKKQLAFCKENKDFRKRVMKPKLASLVQANLLAATEFYRLCSSPILEDLCLHEEPMETFWRSLWYTKPETESDADLGLDFIHWILQDKRRLSILLGVLEQPKPVDFFNPKTQAVFAGGENLFDFDFREQLGEELAEVDADEVQLIDFLSRKNVRRTIRDHWNKTIENLPRKK